MITTSLSLAGCNTTTNPSTEEEKQAVQSAGIERVSSDKFEKMILRHGEAVQLLDVRTPEEYAGGCLENARNIDYYDPDFKNKVAELKKDEPVFIYCAVGGRSAAAAKVLQEQGFTWVIDLAGGITDWKRSGRSVK
ncbi:Rhodanese-like:Rubrerythrin [Fulvivirga imtechensis AK7]|uniref:Rhodanese-like:Rubrerythrin n=2 Tax=Fulvivirga TaxID=396811 RepID=L8JUB1_9BACT|nr:Rhodanese-like:Rubrerythrin [Fulvivirga imtechensis AK7]